MVGDRHSSRLKGKASSSTSLNTALPKPSLRASARVKGKKSTAKKKATQTTMPSATLRTTARERLQALPAGSTELRILNAFLEYAPTNEGLNIIAKDIIDISESALPNGLRRLANFYDKGLLRPMRSAGHLPSIPKHPVRDIEIESEAEKITAELEIATRDREMLKKYALHRDSYRCVISRVWDRQSLSSYPTVQTKYDPTTDPPTSSGPTQAAHIIPFSLMNKRAPLAKCTVWAVIGSFAGIQFNELNGKKINSLTNIITLIPSAHTTFGSLDLWLEAVPGMPNTYDVKKSQDGYHFLEYVVKDGTRITLTSTDPDNLALPDPRYLAFHAAMAKINRSITG